MKTGTSTSTNPHSVTERAQLLGDGGVPRRLVDSSKVWTTLLTNTKYLTGLLTLEYSLRKVGSKYPLLVLYTSTLEPEGREALRRRGIPHQEVAYLKPTKEKDYSNDVRFYDCWSKLQPFGLVEYERVVQLDSDMLVMRNMDELMDIPLDPEKRVFAASHACTCNPLKRKHYPSDWIPENCAYTSQHASRTHAQTKGPSCDSGLSICNGGLQVCMPSQHLYDQILAVINNPAQTAQYDFADQSLLSELFSGRWVPLSYRYNALKTMRWCHSDIWVDKEVKNIHYILSPKPWEVKREEFEEDEEGSGSSSSGDESCEGEERRDGKWEEVFEWWWKVNDERIEEETVRKMVDGF